MTPNTPHGPLITAEEAANILRQSPWWVVKRCRSGELAAFKVGKAWMTTEAAVTAYLERVSNQNDGAA